MQHNSNELVGWPSFQSFEPVPGVPLDFIEVGVRVIQHDLRFRGFRYKEHEETNKLIAI